MSEPTNQGLMEIIQAQADHIQSLQDTVLLLNIDHTALVELLVEGRPITKESLTKRKEQLFKQMQREWKEIQNQQQ